MNKRGPTAAEEQASKAYSQTAPVVPPEQARYLQERAARFKVDIVGRLQWIEAAFEMIEHARRTRTS